MCNHYFWNQKKTCYFCNLKLTWKEIQLADGCYVPICGVCFARMEKGKKLAQERGLYDPSKIPRGGDRMKVEKGNTGGTTSK